MDSKTAPLIVPSRPAETTLAKPSFASVAASSYVPASNKMNNSTTANDCKASAPAVNLQSSAQEGRGSVKGKPEDAREEQSKGIYTGTAPPVAHSSGQNSPSPETSSFRRVAAGPEIVQPPRELHRPTVTDDESTQVSSSDDSAKPPSMDGKSITSATTFALDEKESLRPDDSASLRAVEEEEGTSAAGSVVTGSRVGSDAGGRAFGDQLREISIMAPHRAPPNAQIQARPVSSAGIAFGDGSIPAIVQPRSVQVPAAAGVSPDNPVLAPDEKLLEALESHKDRLWVLKIEQDLIDFINNTQQTRMFLPQCNSFYRMLSHRLADYYGLGHIPDQTGQAVEVFKTHVTRLTMPLSGLAIRSTIVETPPPSMPMRKIMRRGGDKTTGTNTASNSEVPSKATSEAGGDSASASDGGLGIPNDAKSKTAISREEREARYREARLRIFGTVEDSEVPETPEPASEDLSRSSSASGKKKATGKKQRNDNDDGFEARSQFSSYFASPVMAPGFGSDGIYYGPYQPMASPVMPMYVSPYPQMAAPEAQQGYVWSNQPYQMEQPGQGLMSSNLVNYDLSNDFQRGIQSFQSVKPATQPAATMPSPSMVSLPMQYQPQHMAQNVPSWTNPSPFDPNYQVHQVAQSSQKQVMQPIPYAYGQLPGPAYQNGKPLATQHPIPGSFNRQQFNPQSEAFVPGSGGSNAQYPMQQGQPFLYQQQVPYAGQGTYNPLPSRPSPSNTSSPRAPSNPISNPQRPPPPSAHSASINSNPGSNPATSLPTAPNSATQHPLPQPPNPDSTIAKWGTPAHLPPKPPPPASMAPQKWMETHQRTLQMGGFGGSPGLSAASQGVARLAGKSPVNGPSAGAGGGATSAAGAGGGGGGSGSGGKSS